MKYQSVWILLLFELLAYQVTKFLFGFCVLFLSLFLSNAKVIVKRAYNISVLLLSKGFEKLLHDTEEMVLFENDRALMIATIFPDICIFLNQILLEMSCNTYTIIRLSYDAFANLLFSFYLGSQHPERVRA